MRACVVFCVYGGLFFFGFVYLFVCGRCLCGVSTVYVCIWMVCMSSFMDGAYVCFRCI